jgi:hypothetical protein
MALVPVSARRRGNLIEKDEMLHFVRIDNFPNWDLGDNSSLDRKRRGCIITGR